MWIGYARVSTREQNTDGQLDALRAAEDGEDWTLRPLWRFGRLWTHQSGLLDPSLLCR